MRRVVILQSSYIPWKGYFDLIHEADLFIFLDDVQFTARDWRSRNAIKTPKGVKWLTIPAGSKYRRLICEVEIPDQGWKRAHREAITRHYGKAPYFRHHDGLLDYLYDNGITNLSEYNQRAIAHIARLLDISTEFRDSRSLGAVGAKTPRLIELLKKVGATHYVSGPSAKAYLDADAFEEAGIALEWKDYSGYSEYPQPDGPFVHQVSILDVIFNMGPDAPRYISSRPRPQRVSDRSGLPEH